MLKTIAVFEGAPTLPFGSSLCDLANPKVGHPINVTVGEGDAIFIAPMRDAIGAAVAAERLR